MFDFPICVVFVPICVRSPTPKGMKEGKDQEVIQSSTTPDPGYQWKNNKLTIRHHKREPRGQPFSSR